MIPFQVDRFGLYESRDIEAVIILGIDAPREVYCPESLIRWQ
jgi:hypothetical protein